MKKLMMIAGFALSFVASAAEVDDYISPVTGKPYPKDAKYTFEQFKARDERVMKKTGGFLLQKAEGPRALFMDAREKPRLTVDDLAKYYKMGTHLEADIAKEPRGEKVPLAFAQEKMAAAKPLMLILVVDSCADLPALSVFPEERIGIVNADKPKGGDDPSQPEMRVSKEMWRAMGFVGGVGFSQAENDMMQPYYTLAEIDANQHPYIQPMNMAKMQKFWKRFGVKKEAKIPYRTAVAQGWAPAPTNDLQKAVWNEVRAAPTKPLKIEFDPKQGK